ncbi:hypothetical protein BH20ACI4_BH20ACI4_01760 [soil metagenome]
MAVQNIEVTTESILSVIVRMPEREFNEFIKKAKKLRNGSSTAKWTKDEVKLIQKLNRLVFSTKKQARFDELVRKRRDEEISENELKELIELTEESEELNVKRLKILGKLADSKNKSLREIMDILEIKPPEVI